MTLFTADFGWGFLVGAALVTGAFSFGLALVSASDRSMRLEQEWAEQRVEARKEDGE